MKKYYIKDNRDGKYVEFTKIDFFKILGERVSPEVIWNIYEYTKKQYHFTNEKSALIEQKLVEAITEIMDIDLKNKGEAEFQFNLVSYLIKEED
jgi:hypothetical protein